MELGLEYTDKMAIPPGQTAFPLSGYCVADCTRAALPRTGIIIFGSQLHTHLRGVRVLTRHFRGEQELREVNRDDFYSNHFQEMRTLHYKPRVLPVSESWSFTLSRSFFRETSTSLQGDALVTTCYYNTLADKNATLGGFSISDEMCVNYIHYYPATKLEVCKSSVSEETLENYFIYMKRWVWKSHFPLFLPAPFKVLSIRSTVRHQSKNFAPAPVVELPFPPLCLLSTFFTLPACAIFITEMSSTSWLSQKRRRQGAHANCRNANGPGQKQLKLCHNLCRKLRPKTKTTTSREWKKKGENLH